MPLILDFYGILIRMFFTDQEQHQLPHFHAIYGEYFDNGETKIYDMSKLIEKPYYYKLKNEQVFNTVKVCDITLEWVSGEDICPDELYYNSKNA